MFALNRVISRSALIGNGQIAVCRSGGLPVCFNRLMGSAAAAAAAASTASVAARLAEVARQEAADIKPQKSLIADFLAQSGFQMYSLEGPMDGSEGMKAMDAKDQLEDVVLLRGTSGEYSVDVLFNAEEGLEGRDGADDDLIEDDEEEFDDDVNGVADPDEQDDEDEDEDEDVDDDANSVSLLVKVSRANQPLTLHVECSAEPTDMLSVESFWFEPAAADQASVVGGDADAAVPAEVSLDSLSPDIDEPLYLFLETIGVTDELAEFVQNYVDEFDATRTAKTLTKLADFVQ